MRVVQPHLNSCFTQTHSQHNTYPSTELRCNTDRAKSQPGWGLGSKISPVSNGVLRDMATPCSNYRLTRASRISARADLSPSPQLVGPNMEHKKQINNTAQNTETGTLKKSYRFSVACERLCLFLCSEFLSIL